MSELAMIRLRARKNQREELVRLLIEHGGNTAAVARALGVSRGCIVYRCEKFGLLDEPESALREVKQR